MLDLEKQLFHQLEKARSLLIALPAEADGDSLAGGLALFLFLKNLGREVEIVSQIAGKRRQLSFLPAYSNIQDSISNLRRFIVSLNISQAKVSQIKYTVAGERLDFIISPASGWFSPDDVSARAGGFKYDLVITIGAPDLESLGRIYDDNVEFFYQTTIINIDNQAANEDYGQINFVDLNAVATSEILFYLLKNYRPNLINEDVATCLLAGVIQQTKNFKTANLTPRTLLTASELITLNARREEIVDRLYRSRDFSSLKLWGRLLDSLKEENGGRLLWAQLRLSDFQESGASESSLQEIIDELIANVPGARLIVVLTETSPGKGRAHLYALKNLDLSTILPTHGFSAGTKTGQLDLAGAFKTASGLLMEELREKLDKLPS